MNKDIIDSMVAIYRERLNGMDEGFILEPTKKNNYNWILVNTTNMHEENCQGIKQQLESIDLGLK